MKRKSLIENQSYQSESARVKKTKTSEFTTNKEPAILSDDECFKESYNFNKLYNQEASDAINALDNNTDEILKQYSGYNDLTEGDNCYKLGQYSQALNLYKRALSKDPEYASFYNSKGKLLARINETPIAIDFFSEAIRLDPNNLEYNQNKAFILHNLGKFDEALQLHKICITLRPNHPLNYLGAIFVLYQLERINETLQYHDRLITLQPNNPRRCVSKAFALHNLGKFDEALPLYDKAIQLDPNNNTYKEYRERAINLIEKQKESLYISQSTLLYKAGDFEKALQYCDKTIKINSENPISHQKKASILLKLARFDEALNHYNIAIKLLYSYIVTKTIYNKKPGLSNACNTKKHEDYPRIYNEKKKLLALCNKQKAELLNSLKRYDELLKHYDELIENQPDNSKLYHTKASILHIHGKHYESLQCYKKLIDLNPSNSKYYNMMANILQQLGNHKDALAYSQKADKLEEGNPFYHNIYHNISDNYLHNNSDEERAGNEEQIFLQLDFAGR